MVPIESGLFYNVNLPILPPGADDRKWSGVRSIQTRCRSTIGTKKRAGLYYAGDYQLRHRTPGADVDICFGVLHRRDYGSATLIPVSADEDVSALS